MKVGQTITAKFATLNKNETLDQYKEECSKPEKESYELQDPDSGYKWNKERIVWRVESCIIEQIFEVTAKEWETITNSFLDDNIIWRGKGGTEYTGNDPDFDIDKLGGDPEMLQDYRDHNANLVTILINQLTGEAIAINPEGHSYARYVGIDVGPRTVKITPSQFDSTGEHGTVDIALYINGTLEAAYSCISQDEANQMQINHEKGIK